MQALIFLAHGSRRQQSNDEVINLTDRIRPLISAKYDSVSAAFLEIATPSLSEMIDHLIERDAEIIAIYPYFVNSGNHVEQDIPRIIEGFKSAHPNRRFVLMQHFGKSKEIANMIANQVLEP